MADPFGAQFAIKYENGFDSKTLKGKSAVITGGASGLGEAFAREFVKHGAFVTTGDVAAERGQKLVEELGENNAAFAKCDVTIWADQVALFDLASRSSPATGIDLVLANAGVAANDTVSKDDSTSDDPQEPALTTLHTNLIGATYTAKLATHHFTRQPAAAPGQPPRDRHLLLTASMGAYMDMPESPQYNAAKFGVRGLLCSMRHGLAKACGGRVNAVAPYFVKTPLLTPEILAFLEQGGGGYAELDDAVAAVMHLACDSNANGRCVSILPRKVTPQGYVDLGLDAFPHNESMLKLVAGMAGGV